MTREELRKKRHQTASENGNNSVNAVQKVVPIEKSGLDQKQQLETKKYFRDNNSTWQKVMNKVTDVVSAFTTSRMRQDSPYVRFTQSRNTQNGAIPVREDFRAKKKTEQQEEQTNVIADIRSAEPVKVNNRFQAQADARKQAEKDTRNQQRSNILNQRIEEATNQGKEKQKKFNEGGLPTKAGTIASEFGRSTVTGIKNWAENVAVPFADIRDAQEKINPRNTWASVDKRKEEMSAQNMRKVIKEDEAVEQTRLQEMNPVLQKTNVVGRTIGNQIPSILLGQATGSEVVSKLSSALYSGTSQVNDVLSEKEEAETKDYLKAYLTGLAYGGATYGIEGITGGNLLARNGGLDKKAERYIANNLKTKFSQYVASLGYDVFGEIGEENIENQIDHIIDMTMDLAFEGKTDGMTMDEWLNELKQTSVDTGLSTLVMQFLGMGGGTYQNVRREVANASIQNSNRLSQDVKADLKAKLESGEYNAEYIRQVAENLNKKQQLENANKLLDKTDLDEDTKKSMLMMSMSENPENFDRSVKNILDEYDLAINGRTTSQNNEVSNQNKQTTNQDTQNEITTNLMRSIDNYNNSRQEGEKIFDINDENTRKEIESIQKIAEKRGVNITFDESRFKDNSINAFYEYDENGNVANIVLNPNSTSKKYVQNLAIHEMTHSFEGSKEYKALSKAVLNYAKSTGEYDTAFQDLKRTYQDVYGDNPNLNKMVEKEAVANILGEKLGDQQFVEDLVNGTYSTENKTLVQKIYDFVKNQINRFKGYKDQEQYWNHVKELFDTAMNKSEISQEGLKSSVEANKMTETTDSQGRQLSQGQVEHNKNSKFRDNEGNLLALHHVTEKQFNVFESEKYGANTGERLKGIYMSTKPIGAFGDVDMNLYANVANPVTKNNNNITWEQFEELSKLRYPNASQSNIEKAWESLRNTNDLYILEQLSPRNSQDNQKFIDNVIRITGYDGAIYNDEKTDVNDRVYVAFNSNQVKNTDNLNPTESNDIRYSKETGNRIDVTGNDNLDRSGTVFFRTREDGKYYVVATDNSGEMFYEGVFTGKDALTKTLGKDVAEYIMANSEESQNELYIENKGKPVDDYKMSHRPSTSYGDASNFEANMPSVFDNPQWYMNLNQDYNRESLEVLKKVRGNPDAEITIYRATPRRHNKQWGLGNSFKEIC